MPGEIFFFSVGTVGLVFPELLWEGGSLKSCRIPTEMIARCTPGRWQPFGTLPR